MKIDKKFLGKIFTVLAVIAIIAFSFPFLDFENLQEKILETGIWAPLILIVLKASTIVFAPLSGAALYPVAGAVFGFWNGLLYIVLGDTLGATIAFWISRRFGQEMVSRFIKKKDFQTTQKIMKLLETTSGLLFTRICFTPFPEIVAYASGLTKIKFRKFFIINFIADLPPSMLLVWGGGVLTLFNEPIFMALFMLAGVIFVGLASLIFYRVTQKYE
jgi:uncharacterized membrane protein YdjX (TVP38/TMEM64 family)